MNQPPVPPKQPVDNTDVWMFLLSIVFLNVGLFQINTIWPFLVSGSVILIALLFSKVGEFVLHILKERRL